MARRYMGMSFTINSNHFLFPTHNNRSRFRKTGPAGKSTNSCVNWTRPGGTPSSASAAHEKMHGEAFLKTAWLDGHADSETLSLPLCIQPPNNKCSTHNMEKHMTKRYGKTDRGRIARRAAFLLALCAFASATARADVLNIGSKTQKVTLEGYDGRSFQLYDPESGKSLTMSRTSIKDLRLDSPRKAEVAVMGQTEPEEMLMAGYAKGMFLFIKQGKQEIISGMKVTNIKLATVSRFGRPSEPIPEAVQQIADADIENLLARPDLTADQKAALEQYQRAADQYRRFVAESSSLVAKMDAMTGGARQAALNDLRLRKEAEQPLKRELHASQQTLSEAFPEL